ncbi:MAG: peptidase C39 family protein [Kiloniellales bacterium]
MADASIALDTRSRRKPRPIILRPATVGDLDDFVRIENSSFRTDRISRRSFHHLITRGHALCLVADVGGKIVAAAIVLLHKGTPLARLYSFAVDPEVRGQGIGRALLREAERRTLSSDRAFIRLEVRADNAAAIDLYRSYGYRDIGRWDNYYQDGCPALRMEKALAGGKRPELSRVPYYEQTLEFTCGAACLMMAMRALDRDLSIDRKLELRLWREATLIYMTSGHGGCGPFGLALAAHRRGFEVEVYTNGERALFVDTVRSKQKKEVIQLVQADFRAQLVKEKVSLNRRKVVAKDFVAMLKEGHVPLVLVSSYRFYAQKFPHWVVLTGCDERFIYLHDPYIDFETEKTATDCTNIPVTHEEFDRMAQYGTARLRAAVVIRGKRSDRWSAS